jgi:hypothetical protein
MSKEKSKILAIYRPHIIWRIADVLFAILLTQPVLFVAWLFPNLPLELCFGGAMICMIPLAYCIFLIIRALTFRLIVTTQGLILQNFGQREIPYQEMESFDW